MPTTTVDATADTFNSQLSLVQNGAGNEHIFNLNPAALYSLMHLGFKEDGAALTTQKLKVATSKGSAATPDGAVYTDVANQDWLSINQEIKIPRGTSQIKATTSSGQIAVSLRRRDGEAGNFG